MFDFILYFYDIVVSISIGASKMLPESSAKTIYSLVVFAQL